MASPTFGATNEMPCLTEREMQVGELLAWGAAKKEVPTLLREMYGGREIRLRTVENITRGIYAKLHIGKASELSAWWFCHYYGVDKRLCPLKEFRKRLYASCFCSSSFLDFQTLTTQSVRHDAGHPSESKERSEEKTEKRITLCPR